MNVKDVVSGKTLLSNSEIGAALSRRGSTQKAAIKMTSPKHKEDLIGLL